MKVIFIILFIHISFCKIHFLEKYGSINVINSNGIVCLNIEKFNIGKIIHIQFNAVNGKMNNKINYEFRNNISIYNISNEYNEYNENNNPINSMSSTFESETHINLGKKTITKNYFYDIKKNINAKYLIIQYTEGTGEYLIIENTRIN